MDKKTRYCRECGSKTNDSSCEICGRRTLPISQRVKESNLYILEDDIASQEDLEQIKNKKEKARKARENHEKFHQASQRVRTQTKMLQGHEEAYDERQRQKENRSERVINHRGRANKGKAIFIILGIFFFVFVVGTISEHEGEIADFIESIINEDSDYNQRDFVSEGAIDMYHNELFDDYDVSMYHHAYDNFYFDAFLDDGRLVTLIPNSEIIFNLAEGEELKEGISPLDFTLFDAIDSMNGDFHLYQVFDKDKRQLFISLRSFEIDGFEDQFDELLKYFQDNKYYLNLDNNLSVTIIKDVYSYPNNYLMELELDLIDEKVTIKDDARNK